MKKETPRIRILLSKYLNDQCSREEYEELITLSQTPENEQYFKEINQKIWNWPEDPEKKILPDPGPKNRPMRSAILKIAASVAILMGAAFSLFLWLDKSEPIAFTTGNGEVKEIVLPDSTKVTLNANSRLIWTPARSPKEDRLVELIGEAYFRVTRQSEQEANQRRFKGFQVKTSRMTIHVTGTEFNVAARHDNTEVFLQEGSVELELMDREALSEPMVPGQKVTMNNQTGNLKKTESEDLSTSASWITGILSYRDKSLGEVLQNLSELFGVEITCENQTLQEKKINLGVPYMDWENTKRALEMAIGVEISKAGDSYVVFQNQREDAN